MSVDPLLLTKFGSVFALTDESRDDADEEDEDLRLDGNRKKLHPTRGDSPPTALRGDEDADDEEEASGDEEDADEASSERSFGSEMMICKQTKLNIENLSK